jgi:hypothetical protein
MTVIHRPLAQLDIYMAAILLDDGGVWQLVVCVSPMTWNGVGSFAGISVYKLTDCKMAVTKEVFVLDNGACTAKVGAWNADHPRYVT